MITKIIFRKSANIFHPVGTMIYKNCVASFCGEAFNPIDQLYHSNNCTYNKGSFHCCKNIRCRWEKIGIWNCLPYFIFSRHKSYGLNSLPHPISSARKHPLTIDSSCFKAQENHSFCYLRKGMNFCFRSANKYHPLAKRMSQHVLKMSMQLQQIKRTKLKARI